VIDNREVTLREELLKVLPRCKAANFALGYFFLSGYRAIHEAVSKVPRIRLLISGNITGETVDAIVAGYKALDTARVELDKRSILNPEARRSKVEEGKREVRESIELLDPEASSENTVRGLADLIREGRLDVRIYVKGTLHAKCYLFHYEDPIQEVGSGIVGSSNLSISGLVHNSELNLKTNHPGDFAKLCEWFEERWDEAEPF
jgi:phosphatidylserine/phosphatidylglycerophosphate/cardiolipin synthase-like enzyme